MATICSRILILIISGTLLSLSPLALAAPEQTAKQIAPSLTTTDDGTSGENPAPANTQDDSSDENAPALAMNGDTVAFLNLRREKKEKKPLSVPEGFEDLAGPQVTAVDVYYGGDYLTTTLVEYTLESIEFLKPDEVLELVPNLKSESEVLDSFTGMLDRNSELVCISKSQLGCGTMDPVIISVIFDESIFRADIFVGANYLESAEIKKSRFIPDPTNEELSFLQNLNGNYSSSTISGDDYSLFGQTYLSKGTSRLVSQFAHSNGGESDIDTLSVQYDEKQKFWEAGYFRSRMRAVTLGRSSDLSGVAFERTLKTRADLEDIRGSLLTLYLPLRSQVEMYKDGRLLSSRVYNAGNNVLDTSSLPPGSYELELHIKDSNGGLEILNRYFVKTAKIPPLGEKLYYVELGKLVQQEFDSTMPKTVGEWTLRGGYHERLNKDMGLSLGFSSVHTHTLFESGFDWINKDWDLNARAMFSTQGDWGLGTRYFRRIDNFSFSFSGQKTESRYDDGSRSRYLLVPSDITNIGFSASYAFWGGQLTHRRDIYRQSGAEDSDTRTWAYQKPVLRSGKQSLFLGIGHVDNREDKKFSIALDWTFRGDHFYAGGSGEREDVNSKNGNDDIYFNRAANLGWRDADLYPDDLQANVYYQNYQDQTEAGIESKVTSTYGTAGLEYADTEGRNGNSNYLSSARLGTSFGAAENIWAIGGQQRASSSVILDIKSDTRKAVFDVIVNDSVYGIARSGRKTVLHLKPYETYKIKLEDKGEVFVASTNRTYTVTLYPGNVVPITVDAPLIKIAFGKVVQPETVCTFTHENECYVMNMPIKNASIFGTHGYTSTDDGGNFQAEVSYMTRHIFVQKGADACVARLPEDPEIQGDLMFLETLQCEATSALSLMEWYKWHPEEDPNRDVKENGKEKAEGEAGENELPEKDDMNQLELPQDYELESPADEPGDNEYPGEDSQPEGEDLNPEDTAPEDIAAEELAQL